MAEHMFPTPHETATLKVGSTFPSASGDIGFLGKDPNAKHDLSKLIAGKNVLVVSLPGAYTPT